MKTPPIANKNGISAIFNIVKKSNILTSLHANVIKWFLTNLISTSIICQKSTYSIAGSRCKQEITQKEYSQLLRLILIVDLLFKSFDKNFIQLLKFGMIT